jgi:3-hydroxyacyl-CoA dehydrogenase
MSTFQIPSIHGRDVAILGGGVLGRRMACVWAAGGYNVRIRDPSEEQRIAAVHYYETNITQYKTPNPTKPGKVEAFEDVKTAVENAWMVIEAVPEKLALKIDTFAQLEKEAPVDAILCTNSSSY